MPPSQPPRIPPERTNPSLTSRLTTTIHKARPAGALEHAPTPRKQLMAIYTVNTYHTNRARFEVGPTAGGLAQEQIAWVLYKNKYEKCGRCGSWRRRVGRCEGRCRLGDESRAGQGGHQARGE